MSAEKKEVKQQYESQKDRSGVTAMFSRSKGVMAKALAAVDKALDNQDIQAKDAVAAAKLVFEIYTKLHELRYQQKASRNKEKSIAELDGDDGVEEVEEPITKTGIGTGNVRFVPTFKREIEKN